MKRVNSITICKDNYNTREEWEDAIKKMIMSLLDNRQIMTVSYDEPRLGIVVIEFNHDSQEFGDYYPYWLLPEEEEQIIYESC